MPRGGRICPVASSQGVYFGLLIVASFVRVAYKQRLIEEVWRTIKSRLETEISPANYRTFIEDNGLGFVGPETPSELTERGHFGLMGMQESAMLLGGWLSIGSQPGQGTKIVSHVPVGANQHLVD